VFSIVNAAMLRPLPFPEHERLVMVYEVLARFGRFAVAPANFLDWRAQNTSFEGIAAYGTGYETLVGADSAERISRAAVSWDFFDVLGVAPALGRTFRAEEDAVIDEAFAKQHFDGEDAIGRRIDIGNGGQNVYEIVGVVGSVNYEGLDTSPRPTMYAPFNTEPFSTMWMMVKTAGDRRSTRCAES
jgi:hypothetical protein